MEQQRDWNLYGYVIASGDRKRVIQSLSNSPKTPSQLARESQLRITRISSALTDLAERDLVVCLNPKRRKGKIYKLTEKGEQIAEMLSREEKR